MDKQISLQSRKRGRWLPTLVSPPTQMLASAAYLYIKTFLFTILHLKYNFSIDQGYG